MKEKIELLISEEEVGKRIDELAKEIEELLAQNDLTSAQRLITEIKTYWSNLGV